ncbi:MAG: CapA family protein [Bacteroidales bacterium]|nr:CapA family protein [Bacteroidales bacterium]
MIRFAGLLISSLLQILPGSPAAGDCGVIKSGRPSIRIEIPLARPIAPAPDTLSIAIIGDVMMHSRQLGHDHRIFLREIAPALKKADFAVANMEFPLAGPPYTGYPAFSTPDWYAEYIASCGIDVFLTANNHVLDKGDDGFARTLKVYEKMAAENGILYTGSGPSEDRYDELNPLILEGKGLKIALVNFSYGSNMGSFRPWPRMSRMKKEEIRRQLDAARGRGADFVVVLPHWGVEYELIHSASQEEWARWLVAGGADAVVGSHPHVVQDTTHISGVPVIYSIGNAVSNMSLQNTRLELAVTLRFVRESALRTRILEPRLRWMWCTLPGKLTGSYATIFVDEWEGRRSEWLDPSDYDNMMETLRRVSAKTGIR